MAWTTADADKLRTAIASGVMMVRMSDGRQVQYHSLAEMRAALRDIEAALSAAAGRTASLAERSSLAEFHRD